MVRNISDRYHLPREVFSFNLIPHSWKLVNNQLQKRANCEAPPKFYSDPEPTWRRPNSQSVNSFFPPNYTKQQMAACVLPSARACCLSATSAFHMQRGFKAVSCLLGRGLTSVITHRHLQPTVRISSGHNHKFLNMSYSIEERGARNSLDYRVYFSKLTCYFNVLKSARYRYWDWYCVEWSRSIIVN